LGDDAEQDCLGGVDRFSSTAGTSDTDNSDKCPHHSFVSKDISSSIVFSDYEYNFYLIGHYLGAGSLCAPGTSYLLDLLN
jgi:DNA-binding transcriptional regulator WhiA